MREAFKHTLRHYFTLNTLLLALFVVTMGIFFIGMPRYLDDIWYATQLKGWLEGVPDTSLAEGIVATWKEHLLTDNARLANILYVPFIVMPKWIGSGIATLIFGWCIVLSCRLAGISARLSPLLCVALFLFTFGLPWYDSMGVENFQFNYILSTFLALGACIIFLQGARFSHSWMYTLAGFIIGIWHEGFTVALIGSFGMVMMLYKQTRHRNNRLLTLGLIAGMIWMLVWPCSWNRMSNVMGGNIFDLSRIVFILFQHLSFIVLILTLCVAISRRKWRVSLNQPVVVLLLTGAVTALVVHYLTTRTPRTGWWCEICSIILTLYLLRVMMPRFASRYTIGTILPCIPLLTLSFAHQVLVDYYALRISKAFTTALETHVSSGENVVFAEVLDEYSSPLICMYAPDFTIMLAPVNCVFINNYYHPAGDGQFIPVPQELERVTTTSGTPVPPVPGLKDYKIRMVAGHLVMPTEETLQGELTATIDYGYTQKENIRVVYFPFISKADGHRYAYLYPWRRVVEMRLGAVKAMSPTSGI